MKKLDGLIVLILVVIDQISKDLITSSMRLGQSIEVIKDFFYITYAHNTGGAWSILSGQMILFYLVTIIALAIFIGWWWQLENRWSLIRIALLLLIAGTLGNFIDRILYQYVRDFLDFYIFGYNFPIFNVADMCLTIGVGVFILDTGVQWKTSSKN